MYAGAKDPTPLSAGVALGVGVLLYPIAPLALVRRYRSPRIREAFASQGQLGDFLAARSMPELVLAGLFLFLAVSMHLPMLLNGAFPLFGELVVGFPGFLAADVMILALVSLALGVLARGRWAWWGGTILLGAFSLSTLLTLPKYTPADLGSLIGVPRGEAEALAGLPFDGGPLAVFFLLPFLGTLGVLLTFRGRALRS
jgi:hypothetical protein